MSESRDKTDVAGLADLTGAPPLKMIGHIIGIGGLEPSITGWSYQYF